MDFLSRLKNWWNRKNIAWKMEQAMLPMAEQDCPMCFGGGSFEHKLYKVITGEWICFCGGSGTYLDYHAGLVKRIEHSRKRLARQRAHWDKQYAKEQRLMVSFDMQQIELDLAKTMGNINIAWDESATKISKI